MMKFDVKGIAEIKKRLDQMDQKLQKKEIRAALREGAKVVRIKMLSEAPVLSGTTRKAVKVRAGKRRKNKISVIVGVGKDWFKGSTFYAAFVEFGHKIGKRSGPLRTAQRREKAGGEAAKDSRQQVQGKHWMEKSFKAVEPQAITTILSKLKDAVERSVK
jgi:HK97 gp10 family phage protein